MKSVLLKFVGSMFVVLGLSVAHGDPIDEALRSKLDQRVQVPGFGEISFRGPLAGNQGPVVTLFHGVYGGASHRAFRELLPLLDQAGARVYLMDLPGVGESESPRKVYNIDDLDSFVVSFLDTVVKEPSTVVAESLLTLSALEASKVRPDLFRRVVLLSPVGVKQLSEPPSPREWALFERIYNDEAAGLSFYSNLLDRRSLEFFLKKAYYDDSLVDETRLRESELAKTNLDQRWITFSFVGGQFYRPFSQSSQGVFLPVLAIFGKNAESVGFDNKVDREEDLAAIRPDFQYVSLDNCGQAVQREKPSEVVQLILQFSQGD